MPSGPGALFGADGWIAFAISAGVTAGHWRVGPGGMGGAGGGSGGVENIALRKVSHLVWKSTACCPWKLRIGFLSTRLGLVYLLAVKTSCPFANERKVGQSDLLASCIAWM